MAEIDRILDFMVEVEKLKLVLRKTRPVEAERRENAAEHSWHACLSALMLRSFAREKIDIDRVIRMLLIHDLGEIDAGDTIVYRAADPELAAKEAAGVERVLGLLPADLRDEYVALWREFESGQTPDSRFARAVDRVPPLLQNLLDEGRPWRECGITKEQVFSLNARIGLGSEDLWKAVRDRLQKGVEAGFLR